MPPFLRSTRPAGRPEALRARAAEQGYLFLPGLLPPAPLRALRSEILEVCARHGFLDPGAPREEGRARPGLRLREGEPEYMAAYDEIQRLEAFHALPHQPPLLALLGDLFGDEVLPHPRNIARVVFPQNRRFTTPAHQDYVHIQGTEETWTAWIPLSDCPAELGALEVLAGSHRHGVLPVHPADGAGGLGVRTEGLGLEWHGGEFRCGDVLLFHSLCVHRARENESPDRLRLSVDFRYQPLSHPVTEGSLLPHFQRLTWEEIYAGWRGAEHRYYWRRRALRIAGWSPEYHRSARR